jgi:hypothetical protein
MRIACVRPGRYPSQQEVKVLADCNIVTNATVIRREIPFPDLREIVGA